MCAARPHYHYPIHHATQAAAMASQNAAVAQAAQQAAAANNANAAAMISMSRNFSHIPMAATGGAPASLVYQEMRCDQCDFR